MMSSFIEHIGGWIGLRTKETPSPPKPAYIESQIMAATGLRRDTLLVECRIRLAAGELTPDMFYGLTSHMVDLIGGTETEKNDDKFGHSLDRKSHWIEEPESGIVISVGRHTLSNFQSGSITMQPTWFLLNTEETQDLIENLHDLVATEELIFGDGGVHKRNTGEPVPAIWTYFFFAPNYKPPTVKLEMLQDPIPLLEERFDPRFKPRVITNDQLIEICKKTFAAITSQPY